MTSNTNPPKLKLGQEVIHGDLQIMCCDLVDMRRLTPNIEEVMKFQRRLSILLNLNFHVWKSVLD
jgi:hypothetical protein